MRKHSRKILALGVVCLTFLFILSSLFGCKLATIGQSEPEYKTYSWYCYDGKILSILLPNDWPDIEKGYENGTYIIDQYLIGENICGSQNMEIETQNVFVIFNDCYTCEAYGLLRIIGQDYVSWIYKDGKPILCSKESLNFHLLSKITQEKESTIRNELKKQSKEAAKETDKELSI